MNSQRSMKRNMKKVLGGAVALSAVAAVGAISTENVHAEELTQKIESVTTVTNGLWISRPELYTIHPDGTVWRTSWDYYTYKNSKTSKQMPGITDAKSLFFHPHEQGLYVIKSDNTVYSSDYSGKLTKVKNGENVVKLSLQGNSDIYALKSDGTVWLKNNGTGGFIKNPNVNIKDIVDIAGARMLKSDGTVWDWVRTYVLYQGYKEDAKLNTSGVQSIDNGFINKDGTLTLYLNYPNYTNIKNVVSYSFYSILKTDGTVWGFGSNYDGQLGDGTKTDSYKALVQAKNLTDIVKLKSTQFSKYAIKKDGTLWMWGRVAELSDSRFFTPIQIDGLTDVVDVIPHYMVSFAVKSDGTVWEIIPNGNNKPIVRQVEGEKIALPSLMSETAKDSTAPFLNTEVSSTVPTNKAVTIEVKAKDEEGGSGVKSITLPNGNVIQGDTASYTVAENGDYTFKVEDNAGNVTAKTILVSNIDKMNPSLEVSKNTDEWTNKNITLTATGADAESGIQSIQLPDGSFANSGSASFNVTENGEYTFIITDKAGNQTTKTMTVENIDKVKPTAPTSSITPSTIIFEDGTDVGSGVKEVQYSLNGREFVPYTEILALPDGQYAVVAKTIDKVGNESEPISLYVTLYGEQLLVTEKALEVATLEQTQTAVDSAVQEVSELPGTAPEKQSISEQVVEVQKQVTNTAIQEAVDNPTVENYEKALVAIESLQVTTDALPVSDETLSKIESLISKLTNTIQSLEDSLIVDNSSSTSKAIGDAVKFVNKAEDKPNKGLLQVAQKKVDALGEGALKTNLQKRLDALK